MLKFLKERMNKFACKHFVFKTSTGVSVLVLKTKCFARKFIYPLFQEFPFLEFFIYFVCLLGRRFK
jgi:hypothetical protein